MNTSEPRALSAAAGSASATVANKLAANHLITWQDAAALLAETERLRAALIDARASFLGLQPDFGGPIAAQMGKAIQRINVALFQPNTPMCREATTESKP